MTDGSGKFNMPHAFASDFGTSDFDAATVADGAFVTDAFIFTAMAFPIASGAEDAFAEEAVAFGLECTVVDSFRLFNFAMRPGADFIGRGETDAHGVEEINVEHEKTPFGREKWRGQSEAFEGQERSSDGAGATAGEH